MIEVTIERCLCSYGYKPFFVRNYPQKVKMGGEYFPTLKDLRDYYGIAKIEKAGTEWAISSTGKKHVWNIYKAKISETYLCQPAQSAESK